LKTIAVVKAMTTICTVYAQVNNPDVTIQICTNGGTPSTGPIYVEPKPKNCAAEVGATLLSAANAVFQYLSTAAGAAAKQAVGALFAEYGAGEIVASEFIVAAFGILTAPELAAAFGAAGGGLTIAAIAVAIYQYYECVTG
jgi:hypothetical protein